MKLYVGLKGYFPKCPYDVKSKDKDYTPTIAVSVGSTACTMCEHFISWNTDNGPNYVKCRLNEIENREDKIKRILQ